MSDTTWTVYKNATVDGYIPSATKCYGRLVEVTLRDVWVTVSDKGVKVQAYKDEPALDIEDVSIYVGSWESKRTYTRTDSNVLEIAQND
jgi:hypothetical protein